MKQGIIFSALLHLILVLVLLVGLPAFIDRELPTEQAVTVEILPISSKSNVKKSEPSPKKEVEKKKQEPKQPEKKYTQSKPKPTEPKPEPEKKKEPEVKPKPAEPKKQPEPKLAEPIKPEVKPEVKPEEKPKEKPKPEPEKKKEPEPVKTPEKKQEEKPKEKPKPEPEKKKEPEPEEDPFASVLKSVKQISDEEAKKDKKTEDNANTKRAEGNYDPNQPLSLSEVDAVRKQIQPHWNVLSGARNAEDIAVTLRLVLDRDGTVRNVSIVNQTLYNTDPFFRAAADRAVAAVRSAGKLKGLPEEKYSSWGEMNMTFDPKDMF